MSSCSNRNVVVDSNDYVPKKIFENNYNFIFKVTDQRKTDSHTITTYNSRNIRLPVPFAQYVEAYFNKSSLSDSLTMILKKADVFVDQFKFEDYKSLKYSLRFSIPYSGDTSIIFRVSSKYFKEEHQKLKDDEIIHFALTEILDSFYTKNSNAALLASANNIDNHSIKSIVVSSPPEENNINLPADTSIQIFEPAVNEVVIENIFTERIVLSSFALTVFLGDKIENGFQLHYSTGKYNPEGNFLFSIGAGLLFYGINNKDDFFKGHLLSGTFPFSFHYFPSGYESGFYFGATAKLISGQEKIDYGFEEKTGFFIGPSFEPSIGIKAFNSISLDAGIYLLKLFGSEMLPDDSGGKFNLNIWF